MNITTDVSYGIYFHSIAARGNVICQPLYGQWTCILFWNYFDYKKCIHVITPFLSTCIVMNSGQYENKGLLIFFMNACLWACAHGRNNTILFSIESVHWERNHVSFIILMKMYSPLFQWNVLCVNYWWWFDFMKLSIYSK